MSLEDLLTAPSLTADQNGILEVIQLAHDEHISLKYPVSGDWRNPIHFLENTDSSTKAIVFYTVSTEINAHIALVSKDKQGWILVGELVGDGPEVNSVQILQGTDENLLIEWGAVNQINRRLVIYYISPDGLKIGFKEECSDIIMKDFNNRQTLDFLYVTANQPNEPFKLVYVSGNNDTYTVQSEIPLNIEMDALLKLQYEELDDNSYNVFVDERIGGNRVSTEVFKLMNSRLESMTSEQDYDTFQLFLRTSPLISRNFYNINSRAFVVPSDTAPRETIAEETLWNYWYNLKDGNLGYSFASYVNIPLNFNVGIPDSWLDSVVIEEDKDEQRLFRFYKLQTGEILFEIKVLRVEEKTIEYTDDGFLNIGVGIGGIYRYMYRSYEGCDLSSLAYITNHFYSVIG